MEENKEKNDLSLLLESMQAQEKMAKKTLWHQRIRTVLVLLMVLAVVSLVAPVKSAVNDAQAMMADVTALTSEASAAVEELMDTVNTLDLENTLAGIDKLVQDSTAVVENSAGDIEKSLEMIAKIDVAGLNKSIQALETVVTSIGRIFGYRG